MATTYITGVNELKRLIEQVGKVPAKALTSASKLGANMARQDAVSHAPKDRGYLRRGIRIYSEKRKTGKKVYQLTFNRNLNNIFVKKAGARTILKTRQEKEETRYYYPASQEYGFKLRNGKGKKPGKHFIRNAIKNNRQAINQAMVDQLANSIRQFLR